MDGFSFSIAMENEESSSPTDNIKESPSADQTASRQDSSDENPLISLAKAPWALVGINNESLIDPQGQNADINASIALGAELKAPESRLPSRDSSLSRGNTRKKMEQFAMGVLESSAVEMLGQANGDIAELVEKNWRPGTKE